ncbi:DUF3298 and DUF4163 domain-containing protein [Mucilaginibacter sp. AK015]|uniref:DUF3298 and DUF4163 domain-containing protein n=1 Tax=Mucilaginibacter sp. AK015 TaxID=2723072 RepID=UPI00160CBBB0|nr:DUF3298 and DUF4163 domain-containing protein [Mucilaginibacter sp. AK015]MBB5394503.1 hypothetical protein [Mucilaginibacter sp. AK015]
MMRVTSLLLLIVLGLSSCEWGAPAKKDPNGVFRDTLAYAYQTIHERAADCGNKPDSSCTVVKISYPQFKDKHVLNDTIKHKLLNIFMLGENPDTSLNALAAKFLKSYTAFKKDDPRTQMFFTLDTYAKVIGQDSALVTLEYGGYTFQGGAHGASFTGFINWDGKTDKNVTLDDIMVSGYQPELAKIAEKIFRKDEKLSDTSSLARDYFFKDNKFALNENYSITPLGIRFVYNQYEIKPYAAGQTELILPYSQIKKLMRPQSVASQYIHKNAGI